MRARRPPSQRRDVERVDAALDRGARGGGGIGLGREKETDRREVIGRGLQIDAREFADQELARRFAENSRTVTRAAVGRARTAMHHRARRAERQAHRLVRCGPTQIRNEADPAGIVFFGQSCFEIVHRGS